MKGMRRGGVRRRGHGAQLGWQARNEQVTRSTRSSLTGIRTVDWLRIAYPGEEEGKRATRTRAVARLGYPGCVDGCRKEYESEGGEGGFFPIKQPAEFVFSPKRRCRFKVIDCHREGGTDGMGGEPN